MTSRIRIGLAVIAVGFTLLQAANFRRPADVVSSDPILNVDYAWIYYWTLIGKESFFQNGHFWGYDPDSQAGFPLSFIVNSGVLLQVASVLFWWIPPGLLIKIVYLAIQFCLPLAVYAAAVNVTRDRTAGLLGALGSTVLAETGMYAVYNCTGMVPAMLVTYLSVYVWSEVYRYLVDGSLRRLAALGLTIPLVLLAHKTAAVILTPPVIVLTVLLLATRQTTGRRIASLAAVCLTALVLNGFWIYPMLFFLPDKIQYAANDWKDAARFYQYIPRQLFYPATVLRALLAVLAVAGLAALCRGKRKALAASLLFCLAYLAFFPYVSHRVWPGAVHLNPYRYIAPLYLFAIVPAAGVLAGSGFARRAGRSRIHPLPLLLAAFTLLLPLFLTSFGHKMLRCRFTTQMHPALRETLQWIRENTRPDERILMEEFGYGLPRAETSPFGDTNITGLLGRLTGRAYLCGPYPYHYTIHSYAGFRSGHLFGRDMEQIPSDEMHRTLALYNVGWVLVFTDYSRSQIETRMTGFLEPWGRAGAFSVYRVRRPPSFFLRGSGTLKASLNRIELSNVVAEGGEVVLSMHFLETFRSQPSRPLLSEHREGLPVGFFRILDPPEHLVLVNDGRISPAAVWKRWTAPVPSDPG